MDPRSHSLAFLWKSLPPSPSEDGRDMMELAEGFESGPKLR